MIRELGSDYNLKQRMSEMMAFRLLIVEDNDEDLRTCRDTIARYKDEKKRDVELIECRSVEEAFGMLDSSIDGAIIDLRLAESGDEGSQVAKRIEESRFRIPVAILTGTPDDVNLDLTYIGVFKKGEAGAGYADIIDRLWGIHNTGLTRIIGGRGKIEEAMNKVFRDNLLPQKDKWVLYGEKYPDRTEKALLRYALSHLLQLLDEDVDRCFPEEVYLSPPLTDQIRSGSVVKDKINGQFFIVMSPSCDLVIRDDGKINTDRILFVEIEPEILLFPNPRTPRIEDKLNQARRNKIGYYHWIPKTNFFDGGIINFRKLSSLPIDDFMNKFEKPLVQISPSFIKDIVARFSAYYARQGQPDIDIEA